MSSSLFFLISPLPDHPGSQTWPQNWHCHSWSSNLPRLQLMPLTSTLTARTASISLPIYDWDSKDAYYSFSIFWHTLENWLLLNCIMPDSERTTSDMSLQPLGSKSLEMHAQWMTTGSKEEWKVTKAEASAFLDRIQQGMTHEHQNSCLHLGELEDIHSQAWRGPLKILLDASRHLWTAIRWSMMSTKSISCIASIVCPCIPPWGKAPWQNYGKTIQDTF